MVRNFDGDSGFLAEMGVLKAIRWCISAWEGEVSAATIQKRLGAHSATILANLPRVDTDIIVVDIGDRWKEVRSQVECLSNALQHRQARGATEEVGDLRSFISLGITV
jgi:hypothetical protein